MTRYHMLRAVWAACSSLALAHKPITIRGVREMVGLQAYSNVYYHLKHLERAGYITKSHGAHRSMADWVVNIPLITMGVKEGA